MIEKSIATIIIPCGSGADAVLDTADSIEHYCTEPHEVVFVDDCTSDGTYEVLLSAKQPNWHILRNEKHNGFLRLVNTLGFGFRYIHDNLSGGCILKLDTDSLIIGPGIIPDALKYMGANPEVGMFGVYDIDYNRPRDFTAHNSQIRSALKWWRAATGLRPSWVKLLQAAEKKGYRRGEHVFGGAYFLTWACLDSLASMGYLDVPASWYNPVSQLCLTILGEITGRPLAGLNSVAEDVYFSMVTIAAGYKLGHFAAPTGPLCLEHQGLPYTAREFQNHSYKIVHSVDKGVNTGLLENEGHSAREVFRALREKERA